MLLQTPGYGSLLIGIRTLNLDLEMTAQSFPLAAGFHAGPTSLHTQMAHSKISLIMLQ